VAYTRCCALRSARRFGALALLVCLTCAAQSQAAFLLGTTPDAPGTTVLHGVVPPGTPAGTLLASLVSPYAFTTTAGTTSGSLTTAVYREPAGTLDFYYQIQNAAGSATAIDRETSVNFGSFGTSVGYRTDGSSLPGGEFVNGNSAAPFSADRNVTGSVVGFTFSPPETAKIQPGTTSVTLVISTDSTAFTAGNATIIDGGAQTLAAFQPAAVPEPASLGLLAAGALFLTRTTGKRR